MPSVRPVVVCLLVFAIGCGGSHNKEKIEGKWKVVSVSGDLDAARLQNAVLEFDGYGQVLLHLPAVPKPVSWRYKLLAGDAADFYAFATDATERRGLFPTTGRTARVTIRIAVEPAQKYERQDMTLTDPDGRELKLTRVR